MIGCGVFRRYGFKRSPLRLHVGPTAMGSKVFETPQGKGMAAMAFSGLLPT
jgi:hypothetical protein